VVLAYPHRVARPSGPQAIIEAITHDVENAENAVRTAEQQVRDTEWRVARETQRMQALTAIAQRQSTVLAAGAKLLQQCTALRGEVEATQREVARLKDERRAVWELVSKCVNRAQQALYALTKEEYGTAVLQVCEVAVDDHTLVPAAAEVVRVLVAGDDKVGSIKGIKTDEHLEGLLAYVEKKLQQAANHVPVMTLAVARMATLHSVTASLAGLHGAVAIPDEHMETWRACLPCCIGSTLIGFCEGAKESQSK